MKRSIRNWRPASELNGPFIVGSELLYISDRNNLDPHQLRPSPAPWGIPLDELVSRPFIDLVHPDDREHTAAVLDEPCTVDGEAQFENRCIRRDGEPRWFQWSVASDNGMLFGAGRDITQQTVTGTVARGSAPDRSQPQQGRSWPNSDRVVPGGHDGGSRRPRPPSIRLP